MFQKEMFSDGSYKKAKYLSNGCFGVVHTLDDNPDWVVKYAACDGTLNYLEWCVAMQKAGRGMKGMPEIDVLVRIDENRYMVTMRRYSDACSIMSRYSSVLGWAEENGHEYINELAEAFSAYGQEVLGSSWDMVDDLHRGNIMLADDGSLVITDPSASSYMEAPVHLFLLN
jgi:hypothetical protein